MSKKKYLNNILINYINSSSNFIPLCLKFKLIIYIASSIFSFVYFILVVLMSFFYLITYMSCGTNFVITLLVLCLASVILPYTFFVLLANFSFMSILKCLVLILQLIFLSISIYPTVFSLHLCLFVIVQVKRLKYVYV